MNDAVIVGADIGWSTDPARESTGLCAIEGAELVDCSLATSDEEILNYAIKREADFIGIDAPLVVSNTDGQRPVENELQRRGFSVYPANRSWMNETYGGVRGEELVEKLDSYGYSLAADTATPKSVIEVYPNPTIRATIGEIPKYKNANKEEMFRGLAELWHRTVDAVDDVEFGGFEELVPDSPDGVTKRNLKAVGDLVDAFYSAYVLKLDLEHPDRTEIFGDLKTGSILTASE
jgi:predicted RNase H-like nuclease